MPLPRFEPQAVDQYNSRGELLHTYPSLSKASKATGLAANQISRALPGRGENRFTCGGFFWRCHGQPLGPIAVPRAGRAAVRVRLEKAGSQPQEFPSQVAAARHLGVTQGNISAALDRHGCCLGYRVSQVA